jgi:hypothetical protein
MPPRLRSSATSDKTLIIGKLFRESKSMVEL